MERRNLKQTYVVKIADFNKVSNEKVEEFIKETLRTYNGNFNNEFDESVMFVKDGVHVTVSKTFGGGKGKEFCNILKSELEEFGLKVTEVIYVEKDESK